MTLRAEVCADLKELLFVFGTVTETALLLGGKSKGAYKWIEKLVVLFL